MTFDKYAVANKLEEIHRLSLDNQSREAKAKGFATATFRWSANICAPRATSALFGHTTHSLGTSNRADVLIKRYEQNTPRNIPNGGSREDSNEQDETMERNRIQMI